jgi:hypothetical protein
MQMSSIYYPVFDSYDKNRKVVAVILAVINWGTYFTNVLPPNAEPVDVILENNCGGKLNANAYTYTLKGAEVQLRGVGDKHEAVFNSMEVQASFQNVLTIDDSTVSGIKLNQDICEYKLRIFPTSSMYNAYHTPLPVLVTVCIALVFVLTSAVFIIFNSVVERRNRIVMSQALRSTAIVSSLFPGAVVDRLVHGEGKTASFASGKMRLKNFLSDGNDTADCQPIADLFPHTTVFFGDVCGFT